MAVICGVPDDDGISLHNKCTITQKIDGQEITVVGYMSEECQLSLRSLWESPFEGDTAGNVNGVQTTANLLQSHLEKTSKTVFNSQQVWQGQEPPEVTLQLKFMAYTNGRQEVDLPIQYLMQMASPELLEGSPITLDQIGGWIPQAAAFDIGGKFVTTMRISEVSFDVNAPKTPSGNFAYNTVSITAAPKQMINKSEMTTHFR